MHQNLLQTNTIVELFFKKRMENKWNINLQTQL